MTRREAESVELETADVDTHRAVDMNTFLHFQKHLTGAPSNLVDQTSLNKHLVVEKHLDVLGWELKDHDGHCADCSDDENADCGNLQEKRTDRRP